MRNAPTRKTTFNTKEKCKAERTKPDKLHRKQQVITALFSHPQTSPYFHGKQRSGCCFGLLSVRQNRTLFPLCDACVMSVAGSHDTVATTASATVA